MENENNEQAPGVTAPAKVSPIKALFEGQLIKSKFQELLGKKAQGFITSVLQVVSNNKDLEGVAPLSVYNAAATAATLDLPINHNLGFAWIVPYKGQAQFQIGWKGFVQLAQRTGQYLKINVIEVFQNQYKSFNHLTEELDADFATEGTGDVVGYVAYFKLINGFEKTVYWTKAKVKKHAEKYSKAFKNATSPWNTEFDKMAKKTVLKNMLSAWGILSIEMQKAMVLDQAVIDNEEGSEFRYPDGYGEDQEETNGDKSKKATKKTVDMMDGFKGAKK